MTELQHQIASLLIDNNKLSFAGVYRQFDLEPQTVAHAFVDMLNKKWIERQDEHGEILYGMTAAGTREWDNYNDPRWYYANLRPL